MTLRLKEDVKKHVVENVKERINPNVLMLVIMINIEDGMMFKVAANVMIIVDG